MFTLSNFYKSKQWEKCIAVLKLERVNENGEIICEHCGKPIAQKYDCIGHHKVELTEANVNDPDITFNPENIMLIHFRCHNQIHQRFEGFHQKVYLVYGPPCAGKTTWVNDVSNPDDLILDIDRIWECICFSDKYHKPNRLKKNVFGIRDAILDQIKTRTGMWRNAYVVGGYPLVTDRDRLCDLLGAIPIYIDTDENTCLSRARSEEWKDYIYDWFDSYTE